MNKVEVMSTSTEPIEPQPPDSAPAYTTKGLPTQDRETLEEIHVYVEALIEYKEQLAEQPITDDDPDLSDDAEVVEDNGSDGKVFYEYRTCGDDSCHCMSGGEKHGPYRYRAYWDGEIVRREYLGTA